MPFIANIGLIEVKSDFHHFFQTEKDKMGKRLKEKQNGDDCWFCYIQFLFEPESFPLSKILTIRSFADWESTSFISHIHWNNFSNFSSVVFVENKKRRSSNSGYLSRINTLQQEQNNSQIEIMIKPLIQRHESGVGYVRPGLVYSKALRHKDCLHWKVRTHTLRGKIWCVILNVRQLERM